MSIGTAPGQRARHRSVTRSRAQRSPIPSRLTAPARRRESRPSSTSRRRGSYQKIRAARSSSHRWATGILPRMWRAEMELSYGAARSDAVLLHVDDDGFFCLVAPDVYQGTAIRIRGISGESRDHGPRFRVQSLGPLSRQLAGLLELSGRRAQRSCLAVRPADPGTGGVRRWPSPSRPRRARPVSARDTARPPS